LSLSLAFLFLALAALVASMAAYALAGRRRDRDAQSKKAQFVGGAGDFLLHWFLWLVEPATRLSLRLGLSADFYNFAGLGFGILSGALLSQGFFESAGWALAASGVCDILDGRIARALGVASRYGAFVDAVLDRFIELAFFLGYAYLLRHSAHGALSATLALGASVLVSYSRAVGESLGVECTGGLMQRGERLTLLSLACLGDPVASRALRWPPGTLLLVAAYFIGSLSLLTAIQRSVWIAGRLRASAASGGAAD
jgi:phosphatidylglycerophosphate synthase